MINKLIPKPMHVQVQELTVALEKAMAQLKEKNLMVDRLADQAANWKEEHNDMRDNRDFWQGRCGHFKADRDKVMADFLEITKKIVAFERHFGLEEMPVDGYVPDLGLAQEQENAPALPRMFVPDLQRVQPAARVKYVRRGQLVNNAVAGGAAQMDVIERLRAEIAAQEMERLNREPDRNDFVPHDVVPLHNRVWADPFGYPAARALPPNEVHAVVQAVAGEPPWADEPEGGFVVWEDEVNNN